LRCGRHCYRLNVTLSGFASGSHQVACWSAHAGLLSSDTTTAVTSTTCEYNRVNDSVWVYVDSIRSNTVPW
jgi:hypothetical protein